MTRDEAHRRAIEAGARARATRYAYAQIQDYERESYVNEYWSEFADKAEAAITAYLAAMVLPIEEAPKEELVDIWFQCEGEPPKRWTNCYHDAITNQWRTSGASGHLVSVPTRVVTHFTFLPEPPK